MVISCEQNNRCYRNTAMSNARMPSEWYMLNCSRLDDGAPCLRDLTVDEFILRVNAKYDIAAKPTHSRIERISTQDGFVATVSGRRIA